MELRLSKKQAQAFSSLNLLSQKNDLWTSFDIMRDFIKKKKNHGRNTNKLIWCTTTTPTYHHKSTFLLTNKSQIPQWPKHNFTSYYNKSKLSTM